ncbi:MAG: ABC transporter ATP-binding protein [Halioglobus sp.]
MSSQLELQKVQVKYGDFTAVRDVSLSLETGQIGCLLGPSGCGKTTLLRAIAGFESVCAGQVSINGNIISSPTLTLPPEQRKIGMVFQDFALFPHMNIQRNIGFGLAKLSTSERQKRVAAQLELVGLQDYASAFPHELSGGQQQRVALARAMAPNPDLLLLDEPFSSLDSELREQLAAEVRFLLKQRDITAILVTHDQHEAFAMADHITLLNEGSVAQSDTPYNLYHTPLNEFAANFIGQGAVVDTVVNAQGELENSMGSLDKGHPSWTVGETLRILIRPDDVRYDEKSPLALKITTKSFRGAEYLYELELEDRQRIPCLTSSHVDLPVGGYLPITFDLRQVIIFPTVNT